jgi:CubicO group peptidase (beta-lactamase class C family)
MKGLWIDHIQYGRARDMARFGLLNLAKGIWDGDTLLHDQDYLTSMHTPSQALNNSYGYLWWLNGQTSFMLPGVQFMVPGPICPNAPADMYAALGKNDQKIHVVPSKGWVVVRQGNSANVSPVPIVFDNLMWGYLNQLECTSTAFEPEKQTLQVEIAPTVTAQYWTLTTSKPVSRVAVYSGVGARVMDYFTTSDSSGITIPTSQFAPGWYYIVLTDAAGQQTVVKGAKM